MRAAIDLYYQQHNAYPAAVTAAPSASCTGTGVVAGAGTAGSTAAFSEQLSMYTDAKGGACSYSDTTNHKFGPYMKKAALPPDPIMNVATLVISTAGNLSMAADGAIGGWKYDTKTGKIIMNHTTYQGR
jgi:hypothetical protein